MRIRLLALMFSAAFVFTGLHSSAQSTNKSLGNLTIGIRSDGVTIYVNLNGEIVGFNMEREDFDISYYDRFEGGGEKEGKLKTLGSTTFDYYDRFSWEELNGKLKSVGSMTLEYNDRFSINDPRGKLKAVGPLRITYYTSYDGDKEGRIKSISGANKNVFVSSFYKLPFCER